MTSETQLYFNLAVAVFGGLGGWILNNLRDSIQALHRSDAELTSKLQNVEVLVAGSYIKRDDFDKRMESLLQLLVRIEAKLDSKADKSTCQAIHQ